MQQTHAESKKPKKKKVCPLGLAKENLVELWQEQSCVFDYSSVQYNMLEQEGVERNCQFSLTTNAENCQFSHQTGMIHKLFISHCDVKNKRQTCIMFMDSCNWLSQFVKTKNQKESLPHLWFN